mgnify:CR=1 FL=1
MAILPLYNIFYIMNQNGNNITQNMLEMVRFEISSKIVKQWFPKPIDDFFIYEDINGVILLMPIVIHDNTKINILLCRRNSIKQIPFLLNTHKDTKWRLKQVIVLKKHIFVFIRSIDSPNLTCVSKIDFDGIRKWMKIFDVEKDDISFQKILGQKDGNLLLWDGNHLNINQLGVNQEGFQTIHLHKAINHSDFVFFNNNNLYTLSTSNEKHSEWVCENLDSKDSQTLVYPSLDQQIKLLYPEDEESFVEIAVHKQAFPLYLLKTW